MTNLKTAKSIRGSVGSRTGAQTGKCTYGDIRTDNRSYTYTDVRKDKADVNIVSCRQAKCRFSQCHSVGQRDVHLYSQLHKGKKNTHTHTLTSTQRHKHVRTQTRTHARSHAHAQTYARTQTETHTHTYTEIHTHGQQACSQMIVVQLKINRFERHA